MNFETFTRQMFGFIRFPGHSTLLGFNLSLIALAGSVLVSTNALAATSPLKVTLNAPSKYKMDVLRAGKVVYTDRNHVFTDVAGRFNGLCFVRPAANDHKVRNNRLVSFTASKKVTVFVGFDARIKTLPKWVNTTWKKTGESLGIQAYYPQTLNIYRKNFPAGKVVLGGNENGFKTYVAAIKDQDGTARKTCSIASSTAAKTSAASQPASKRLNLKMQKPANYKVAALRANAPAYIDRSFKISSVPSGYKGMCYIRTADNNSNVSNQRAVIIKTNKRVNVYVGFDARIKNLPGWVNRSWSKTGKQLKLQAKYTQKMNLYRKTFPAGQVVLGGNEVGYRHYVALVEDPQSGGVSSCSTQQTQKTTLTYSWKPSRSYVKGYRIYQGASRNSTNRLVSVVRVSNPNLDPARPSIKFDAWKLLGQFNNKTTCFRVSAFNNTGESGKSRPLCMKL